MLFYVEKQQLSKIFYFSSSYTKFARMFKGNLQSFYPGHGGRTPLKQRTMFALARLHIAMSFVNGIKKLIQSLNPISRVSRILNDGICKSRSMLVSIF